MLNGYHLSKSFYNFLEAFKQTDIKWDLKYLKIFLSFTLMKKFL